MKVRWETLTKPGSNDLSAKGMLALGTLQMLCAVALIHSGDAVIGFLAWMMAVPASMLMLVGGVATGVQIAHEEEQSG